LDKPWGEIKFIHHLNGETWVFYSYVNELNGDRLSAFNTEPPSIGDSLKWVKSVFRDIRTKAEVLECIGTL
jgi:hypothetical protein